MNKVIANSLRVTTRSIKFFKNLKEAPHSVAVKLKQRVLQNVTRFMVQIEEFKALMPLISKLRHPGVRTRHWEMMAKDITFRLPPEPEFTLGYVLQLHLENHIDIVNKITDVAINEFIHENALDKMYSEMVQLVVFSINIL